MKKIVLAIGMMCLVVLCGCGERVKFEPYPIDSGYVVMRSDVGSQDEIQAAVNVQKAVAEVCPDVKLATDWVKRGEPIPSSGKEILVGITNRSESETAAETLRVGDYTIRREGERILILGGSDAATLDAVEYFVSECIGENGNLLLPPEGSDYTYRESYPLEALTLNGQPIRDYTLVIPAYAQAMDRAAADRMLSVIAEQSGWMLKTEENDEVSGPTIRVLTDEHGDANTWQIQTDGEDVIISGSGRYARLMAINSLTEKFVPEGKVTEWDVKLDQSLTEPYEAAPLIQFNLPESYPAMNISAAEDGGVWEAFQIAVNELPEEVTVLEPFRPENYPMSLRKQVYVSPDGDDNAAGTQDAPLRTPQAALDRIVGTAGSVVWLKGGVYTLDSTLTLTAKHSGTDLSPTFVSAVPGEEVTLTSGISLERELFQPVAANTPRIHASAAKNILVCDLSALGLNSLQMGVFTTGTRPLLYLDGRLQHIARYPNADEPMLVMGKVVDPGKTTSTHSANYAENKNKVDGWVLKLNTDRPKNWANFDNIWIHGAVYAEWERMHYPVDFDLEKGLLSSSQYCQYGARWQDDNDFYYYNILEELDAPGEWYVDVKAGKLYVYPDSDFEAASFVTKDTPIIEASDTENVIISGLTITGTMNCGISIKKAQQTVVQECILEQCGTNGLRATDSRRTGVIYSSFFYNGSSQCHILNSERAELIPDHNFIQNCMFEGSVKGATYTGGVGMVVSHNYIDGEQSHVTGSNECIFEYNEYYRGSVNTADAGMIYVGGSDRSSRGNHFRYNYFHDMAASHAAVYIDDCSSGQFVYGNIVDVKNEDTSTFGGKMTYRLHNGRECVFYNNISIGATRSAFSDNANYYQESSIRWDPIAVQFVERGEKNAKSEVFAARYPIFAVHYERILQHLEDVKAEGYTRNALEEELREPAHNVYRGNIIVDATEAFNISEAGLRTAVGIDENYVSDDSPLDSTYQVKDKSVLEKLPDYKDVPFAKMGLVD